MLTGLPVHRSLEKATTREVNREKPHSVKNARKQLYQRVRSPTHSSLI